MLKHYKIYLLVLAGLVIFNLALFSLNLNDFFVSDDFDWLYLTKTSTSNPLSYFTTNYLGESNQGGSYRPMVNLFFSLNYHLFGLNQLPYHLVALFFHIGVCFLIYLLVLRLFSETQAKQKIALLAAVFFSLLPNHSEAVIWVAAVADPLATFFYLLAFYGYLVFRQQLKFHWLLLSVASFILGLLTKEFVITLPLLIVLWELYEAITKNKFRWQDIILKPFGYWVFLLGYFVIRYYSIGVAFGYYAEEKFRLDWLKLYKMFVALTTNLFFYGHWRVGLTDYFVANKLLFVLLFILAVTGIIYALRNYGYKSAFLIDAYLILILPVLPLAYNYFNDEGERYVYLPSVVFCILLSLLVWQIKQSKLTRYIIMVGLLIYFGGFLFNKNYTWHLASQISQKAVLTDFPKLIDLTKNSQQLVFVGLPDNLEGAQLFRNALVLGLQLYHPDYQFSGQTVPAYIRLTRKIAQEKVLYWGPYPTGGWIAKTFDQKFWVTGFDHRETKDYVFELWKYNYANYTSDTIRFYLVGDLAEKYKNNQVTIVTYVRDGLEILK